MLTVRIDDITLELLDSVCAEAWTESPTLEFKRDAPGSSDKEKHELLKDISALANAEGGDVVFGLAEKDGVADAIVPICSESADSLIRRVGQTVETGIEPRLNGIQYRPISTPDGFVLVVRVPASFQGPHCIKVNSSRRFVMRNGTNTTDLTYDQLRSAFDRTATLGEMARRFVHSRQELLIDRKTPKPIVYGPMFVVHFVPLSGVAGKQSPDLQGLYNRNYSCLLDDDWGGGSRVFNLDGLVVYPGGSPDEGHEGYAQIFRTGAIEAVSLGGGSIPEPRYGDEGNERLVVWSLAMTEWFRHRTETLLTVARNQGLSGPAILAIAILHVGNYELAFTGHHRIRAALTPDRPHLIAPEVWIDNLEATPVDEVVRPLLDMLWQGFGADRCPHYDSESGEYKPRR